jgi:hypothetical protein
MDVPKDMVTTLVAISIVLGAAQCCFGYRIFRIILAITGFIVGAVLAGALGFNLSGQESIGWLSGLVGGLLGAGLLVMLFLLGVFLVGAAFGAVLTGALYASAGNAPEPIVVAIVAIVAGAAALAFQKFMIIVSTAFGGAASIVAGVAHFALGSFDAARLEHLVQSGGTTLYVILGSWLGLGLVGVLAQYGAFSSRRSRTKTA